MLLVHLVTQALLFLFMVSIFSMFHDTVLQIHNYSSCCLLSLVASLLMIEFALLVSVSHT